MATLPKIAGAKKHRNANSIVPKDQQELMDKVYNGAQEIIFKHKQAAALEASLKKQDAPAPVAAHKGPRIAGPVVSRTGIVNKMLGVKPSRPDSKVGRAKAYVAAHGDESNVAELAALVAVPLSTAKRWIRTFPHQ